jgi:hypothetical protein
LLGRFGVRVASGELDGVEPATRIGEEETMSEEQQKREEAEVEGHLRRDDVHEEPAEEGFDDDDFEAHKVRPKTRPNLRMD